MLCLIFICMVQERISTYEAPIPTTQKIDAPSFNDTLAAETVNVSTSSLTGKMGQKLSIDSPRDNIYFFEGIVKPNTKKIFQLFQSFHPKDFSKLKYYSKVD